MSRLAQHGKKNNVQGFEDAGTVEPVKNTVNTEVTNEVSNEDKTPTEQNGEKEAIADSTEKVGTGQEEQDEQEEQESSKTDISALVKGVMKNKPEERVPHTIYLKKSTSDAFLKFGKDNGKGAKSTLVNELLDIALAEVIEQLNKKNKK